MHQDIVFESQSLIYLMITGILTTNMMKTIVVLHNEEENIFSLLTHGICLQFLDRCWMLTCEHNQTKRQKQQFYQFRSWIGTKPMKCWSENALDQRQNQSNCWCVGGLILYMSFCHVAYVPSGLKTHDWGQTVVLRQCNSEVSSYCLFECNMAVTWHTRTQIASGWWWQKHILTRF